MKKSIFMFGVLILFTIICIMCSSCKYELVKHQDKAPRQFTSEVVAEDSNRNFIVIRAENHDYLMFYGRFDIFRHYEDCEYCKKKDINNNFNN